MIKFYTKNTTLVLTNKKKIKIEFERLLHAEEKKLDDIKFIFSDDEYILTLNQKFLNHNTYTDILTFQFNEIAEKGKEKIGAEIYISIQRVQENSKRFKTIFKDELLRVMIHGVLHLCGYQDKNKKQRLVMREKENLYLNNFCST